MCPHGFYLFVYFNHVPSLSMPPRCWSYCQENPFQARKGGLPLSTKVSLVHELVSRTISSLHHTDWFRPLSS